MSFQNENFTPPPFLGIRRLVSTFLVSVFALIVFTGCVSSIPVNREIGVLSFETPNIKQEAKTKYAIAVVTSELKGFEEPEVQQRIDPFTGQPIITVTYSPVSQIKSKSSKLETALNRTFMEIITKKGFTTKGPYDTFDDMTYLEKNDTYLAIVPQISFKITKSSVNAKPEDLYYSERGTLTISGEFYMKIVEPLTNQALINRRINLSDFTLSKPYIYERQTPQSAQTGMVGSMMNQLGKPDSLTDNTDKVTADLLNEFYAKSVERIVQYLSREELLSIEKDVQNLKSRKVY